MWVKKKTQNWIIHQVIHLYWVEEGESFLEALIIKMMYLY